MSPELYVLEVKRSRSFRGVRMSSRQRRIVAGAESDSSLSASRGMAQLRGVTRQLEDQGAGDYYASRAISQQAVSRRLRAAGSGGPSKTQLNRLMTASRRTQRGRNRMWANRMQSYGARF
ncbi:MAG: hypothetical protein EBS23_05985 [Betaproteobacteria bacterium]|jgi:hypothetical protein|nr:hypothetical protein [Betaproteobacteria bacterium]